MRRGGLIEAYGLWGKVPSPPGMAWRCARVVSVTPNQRSRLVTPISFGCRFSVLFVSVVFGLPMQRAPRSAGRGWSLFRNIEGPVWAEIVPSLDRMAHFQGSDALLLLLCLGLFF